jgi:hypothetical protein
MPKLALIMDLERCLACQKVGPEINGELCKGCAEAWIYVAPTGRVGKCPLCPPGDWADLYWNTYSPRENEWCLTHNIFIVRTIRERRAPDFATIGCVQHSHAA